MSRLSLANPPDGTRRACMASVNTAGSRDEAPYTALVDFHVDCPVDFDCLPERHCPPERGPEPVEGNPRVSLAAYKGLGSWIDVFNSWVWAHPWRTVAKMHKRGVETIYLQTATHGSDSAVVYPDATRAFLMAAHRNGMRVVGWYVPSFARPGRDFRMARKGLLFETKGGHRFDSFALDIEAPNVDNIFKIHYEPERDGVPIEEPLSTMEEARPW